MKTLFLSVLLTVLPLQALSAQTTEKPIERIGEVKKEVILIYEGVTYRICVSGRAFHSRAVQKLTKDGAWESASDKEEKMLKELGSDLSMASVKGQLLFFKKK
ncbi:MAG TPA: hypothetical protein VGE35_00825 [Candidatus Paceibacterota bacterium]